MERVRRRSYGSHGDRGSFFCGRDAILGALLGLALPAVAACAGPSLTPNQALTINAASGINNAGSYSWTFTTLDNPDDGSYNNLSGINNRGKISGFSGNGKSDPYRGYTIVDYGQGKFRNEEYPSSSETQITSLNNNKAIAGWYVPKQHPKWVFGCILQGGIWTSYRDLQLNKYKTNITRLLGINDASLAVGYYTDDQKNDHAFELNATTNKFHSISPPGGISVEATGLNGKGDIVGFMTTSSGAIKSWLLKGGQFTVFTFPNSTTTKALGINWQDHIVGSYQNATGPTHGFLMTDPLANRTWQRVDETNAHGKTVVTGIQNYDYLVGYYRANAKGSISGFLATPK